MAKLSRERNSLSVLDNIVYLAAIGSPKSLIVGFHRSDGGDLIPKYEGSFTAVTVKYKRGSHLTATATKVWQLPDERQNDRVSSDMLTVRLYL